ncbi:keratin, type I cytoskeletal 9 isoform X2 [Plodia interpunctella]|uniref:keratin, type I cytoskeletal 9 isoform X2 n=1 Tax=Plodia interpunctella TaxID=58824 RepID=UPI002368BD62|nr:keratin, type I cytoskeletal 9 isoform X2 [Plodia interpunctella]
MCSPCGPMVCYKYEDCGPPKGKPSDGASGAEEGGSNKKDEKENQLKRIKSRELRGGVMYYSCHCIKRNGLQHDCRRTGCGGEPACLVLPDPVCLPSQLARARGLADPAPFAAHMQAASGGGGGASSGSAAGGGSGKRFIVCELKGISPDASSSDKGGKCCCCSGTGGATGGASGGPAAGLPVLVMKLC